MLSEILGFLATIAVDKNSGTSGSRFRVNLNKNRIRSISAYSSNSIFYFPMIISDDCTPDEIAMVSRTIERMNASFVVACISLMPFHRIKADDKASIEEYLRQFHQNMGFNRDISGAAFQKFLGFADTLEETYTSDELKEVQDFLMECWDKSKKTQRDFMSIVSESVSILEMFNDDPLDPKTRILKEQYLAKKSELETWGFVGEATDEMFGLTAEELLDAEMEADEDWDDDDDIDPDDYPDDAEEDLLELLGEAALKSSTRNNLSADQFGLPSQRKYPLNDKKHVRLAIQMFKHCPEDDRKELADNIQAAMKKYNMSIDIGEDSAISKYMNENVGKAITSVKFALESVSENKIMSCKNLTKLKTLENKLLTLKNKYIKYLNRYKKKWKENQKSGKKGKISIRFNNVSISDPKAFMKEFGEYIKIINKRLKLIEKRRAQLHSARGDVVMTKDWKEPKETKGDDLMAESAETFGDLGKNEMDLVHYCITKIDEQLKAPDSQVFDLIEDEDDEVLDEASNRHYPKRNNNRNDKDTISRQSHNAAIRGLKDSNRKLKDAVNRQEHENKLQKELLGRTRENLKTEQRNKAALERENLRLQKDLEDERSAQSKTRAQLQYEKDQVDKDSTIFYHRGRPQGGINPYLATDAKHTTFKTFDNKVFTDMDMRKANDAVPTFAKATIGFVIDETEEVVSRDILVGIKSHIHKAPAMELITDVYNGIINKRKFLRFVKFITGEERSLADLLFGFKELRSDALDGKAGAGQWRSAFKRRRRWAKMSVPYLMKEYTPNGTLVMTMNSVDFIKSEYGVDIMTEDHVRMIMDADFLLSFVIIDQANEMVYIVYDGQGYTFQQYTYNMLERQESNSMNSRELRDLYRAMSR